MNSIHDSKPSVEFFVRFDKRRNLLRSTHNYRYSSNHCVEFMIIVYSWQPVFNIERLLAFVLRSRQRRVRQLDELPDWLRIGMRLHSLPEEFAID